MASAVQLVSYYYKLYLNFLWPGVQKLYEFPKLCNLPLARTWLLWVFRKWSTNRSDNTLRSLTSSRGLEKITIFTTDHPVYVLEHEIVLSIAGI